MTKERKPTVEELMKGMEVKDGQCFSMINQCFYAVIKEGKITVPKKILDSLKVKDGDMVQIEINVA
jgi:hypothetical protein